jgi:hypothetical protein
MITRLADRYAPGSFILCRQKLPALNVCFGPEADVDTQIFKKPVQFKFRKVRMLYSYIYNKKWNSISLEMVRAIKSAINNKISSGYYLAFFNAINEKNP